MRNIALLATLCACATVPMAREDLDERAKDAAPLAGSANVYVYRPQSVFGVAVALDLFLDESWVGGLASGTFAQLAVPPR